MASTAFAVLRILERKVPEPERPKRRIPEWKRLINRCEQLWVAVQVHDSDENLERLRFHLELMACNCSKHVAAARKDYQRKYDTMVGG